MSDKNKGNWNGHFWLISRHQPAIPKPRRCGAQASNSRPCWADVQRSTNCAVPRPSLELATLLGRSPTLYPLCLPRPSLDLATLLGRSPTLYPLRHELVVFATSEPRTRDLVGQKSNALPTAPRAPEPRTRNLVWQKSNALRTGSRAR
ncbi:unnamed protein product [Schistocephalus solidus]|uniref:Uncharacterized protein n=1 Tax=Schistocephalus solidus TaxID=70667 RepID=A0A183S8N0_SCHSO|nr:unnamed protein product [Schistocephalus solidus]